MVRDIFHYICEFQVTSGIYNSLKFRFYIARTSCHQRCFPDHSQKVTLIDEIRLAYSKSFTNNVNDRYR